VAAIAAACGGGGGGSNKSNSATNSNAQPKQGGTLTVGLDAETDGWNPTADQWALPAYYVAHTIFDPLTAAGADGHWHPNLAQSFTPNSDYTEWTIKLRSGVQFQDGEPLNADALKLDLDKAKASFLVGQTLSLVKSIDKVDDLSVKVTMTQPWVAFPWLMSGQPGFIAAPKQLNAPAPESSNHPIGTGPFAFKEWRRDDHLTVTRNPNYWRKDANAKIYLDQITYRVIPDEQARVATLESGQIDLAYTPVADTILKYRKDHSLQLIEQSGSPGYPLMINTAVAPTDDLRVRQALADALDTKQIIQLTEAGITEQADGPWSKNSKWYSPTGYPMKPDLEKAKQLVQAYEKDKGLSSLKITLGCTPTPFNTERMDLIKQQWKKAGIDVTVDLEEQAKYINDAVLGSFQVNCWAGFGEPDPDFDYVWWISSNAKPVGQIALNFPRNKDAQLDAGLEEGRRIADDSQRKAAYSQVTKRLAATLPYLWIDHQRVGVLFKKNVHNVNDYTLADGSQGSSALVGFVTLPQIWFSK
jgi:ABC-type transport system substrate-binding protein